MIAAACMSLGLLLAGCGDGREPGEQLGEPDGAPVAEPDGAPVGEPDGATDADRLERAVEVVRAAATYVSFDYSANGCHDRTILLAAELAAAGIPSNAQFIVAGKELLTPRPYPGLEWSYHVAPVIYLPGSEPPTDARKFLRIVDGEIEGTPDPGGYVLDPALYPDQIAVPLETWVHDLTGEQQDAFLSAADAREALDPPGDEGEAIERIAGTIVPATLDEMPKLWQFQLGSACSFLSRDAGELEREIGAEAVAQIRRDMNTGVIALLEVMLPVELLLEPEPIPTHPCWDIR